MVVKYSSPHNKHVFNALVWEIVRQIPVGKVATYGQIARLIPPPGGMNLKSYQAFGARWVGGAMAACPEGVPWQRVINSQGKISLNRASGSEDQRTLLEDEGVAFDQHDRIDLKLYGWEGPSSEWLKGKALIP
jgi:methylated-DNA-protein-cysteine methyltransferase related protein